MFECPYCGSSDLINATSSRPRPDTQVVKTCNSCSGHSVKANGRVYPVHDRTDPNADAVLRVID